jgi:hypothetical protein
VTATQLRDCLQPVLPKDVLLVSDGAAAYRRFAADAGIMHEAVNVQNVNGWHSRFETWLVRFKKAQPTRTQPFYRSRGITGSDWREKAPRLPVRSAIGNEITRTINPERLQKNHGASWTEMPGSTVTCDWLHQVT